MEYTENDNLTPAEQAKVNKPHCFWCGTGLENKITRMCNACSKRQHAYQTMKQVFNKTLINNPNVLYGEKSYNEAYNQWFRENYKEPKQPKVWQDSSV